MSLPSEDLALILALCAGGGNAAGELLVLLCLPAEGALRCSVTVLAALTQIGAGILIAVALLEFVPVTLETMRPHGWAAPLILLGYLLVHLVEHVIVPQFGRKTAEKESAEKESAQKSPAQLSASPHSVVIALMVHSFFNGVAIGAAALLSSSFGWLVFAAILMHKGFPLEQPSPLSRCLREAAGGQQWDMQRRSGRPRSWERCWYGPCTPLRPARR